MEGASNTKESSNNTDSDAGQNNPCAVDRKKWCEKKEEYNIRLSGGEKTTSKEMKYVEETTGWFHTGSTMNREYTERYKRTGVCGRSENIDTGSENIDTGYTCGRRSSTRNRGGYRYSREI
jgi:hypothetical protein